MAADITALDYGDDPTPHACACPPCVERAELRRLKRANAMRVTTFEVPDPPPGQPPFTVLVSREGVIAAKGRGETEEEALYEALRLMGVVP